MSDTRENVIVIRPKAERPVDPWVIRMDRISAYHPSIDPYNNIPRYETIQGTVRGNAPENVVKRAAEIAKALDLIGADLSELNFR